MNTKKDIMSKNVCVVGAGLSGLCTMKELKEAGHNVTCYELSSDYGGAFSSKGNASLMYENLRLTVSNFFMAFSSMPPAAGEERKYWTANEYYDYLTCYVEKFDLLSAIRFQTSVKKVTKLQDCYQVEDSNGDVESFDAIVLCTGTNRIPNEIELPKQDRFNGKIIHTSGFKDAHSLVDKRVVCIGVGESGVDVANEAAKYAKECTIVARRRPSVVPRYIKNHTGDAFTSKALNWLTPNSIDAFMKLKARFYLRFHPNLSDKQRLHFKWIKENPSFFNRFLTKNDDFINQIVEGNLEFVCSGVQELTEKEVVLTNGQHVQADVILLNTGYLEDFEAVSSFVDVTNVRKLYKHMISPELGETFALIGWARPTQGGVPLCSELQARYLAQLLSGEKKLPPEGELARLVKVDEEYEESIFMGSDHIKGLVNYHQFVISLANLVGCKPNQSLIMQPKLSYKMWFGSHLPMFYRLNGPGCSHELAKDTIQSLPTGSSVRRNIMLFLFGFVSQFSKREK